MLKVVFTGAAVDKAGQIVSRYTLEQACAASASIVVQPSVTEATDLLVASRSETLKARKARQIGVRVVTYSEFFENYLSDAALPRGERLHPYADKNINLAKSLAAGSTRPNVTLWEIDVL